jgi:hypothetical protein
MIGKILLGIVVILVVFVVIVARRPSAFHIERSTSVRAAPDVVFAQLNDFHACATWSPWEKLDPRMARTHSGARAGVGAAYAWRSEDSKVGQGRMTIKTSDSPSLLVVKLEFINPFTATNTATLSIDPTGDGSRVNWAMDGHNGFLGKMFYLFMNMDKMVGGDFERGLANLKHMAESAPRPAAMAGAALPG